MHKIKKIMLSVLLSSSLFGSVSPVNADTSELHSAGPVTVDARTTHSPNWFQATSQTQKIINAHKNDFNYKTVESFLKKKGGYKAYVRSLGGVFAKYVDFKCRIKNAQEFYEVAEYVWGLYDIWGLDYSNGSTYSFEENRYKAWNVDGSGFYDSSAPSARFSHNYGEVGHANGSDLPDIDTMLANPRKYYGVTNCGQGVAQLMKKAGLVNKNAPDPGAFLGDWVNKYGYHVKFITNSKDLQPGDVLIYNTEGSLADKTKVVNWHTGYKHTNVVVARNGNTLTFADSGHAYTYFGQGFYTMPASEKPYQWAKDWVAFRYDEIARYTVYGGVWKHTSKGWWFQYNEGGYPANKWEKIAGEWYYFGSDGYIKTGVQKINGHYYFLTDNGMKTGWQKVNNKWYYFTSTRKGNNPSGSAFTGWQWLSYNGKSNWYYFNEEGTMHTGWLKLPDAWYYLKADGSMVKGKQTINGHPYTFASSGALYAVNIIYDMNGGKLAAKHGKEITASGSTILINKNKLHEIAYNGGSTDKYGLSDYNNPAYINITKPGYIAKKGAEWNTKADGTGKSYSMTQVYNASAFANTTSGNKTVRLYVNWVKAK